MVQFRAEGIDNMKNADYQDDYWIIPREDEGGCTLRYALYQLLVHRLRRC